jgi:uncharacterized protein (TIGR03067 family)
MKVTILTVLSAATVLAWSASVFFLHPGQADGGSKDNPHVIGGDWSLVFNEYVGGPPVEALPTAPPMNPRLNLGMAIPASVCTFSIGKMKLWHADNDGRAPPEFYNCGLDPKGKLGTMDLEYLGRERENLQIKSKAIYLVKDDWLFICEDSETRPTCFATDGISGAKHSVLRSYRRGILKTPVAPPENPPAEFLVPAPPKDATERRKVDAGVNPLEGTWSEFLRESNGVPTFARAEKRRDGKETKEVYVKRVWKFSKDMAEKGLFDGTFPSKDDRWRCKFNPDAKPPTIDAILVDKDGKEHPQYRWKAIYEIIDHHMLICVNSSDPPVRPEWFTTSAKTGGTTLYILRRAK